MPMAGSHRRYRLPPILPVPHRIDPQPGRCLLSPASPVRSEFDDPRVARLAEAICRGSRQESDGASVPDLVLARNEPSDMATQGYRLDVVPRRVTVTASDAPGCFYGLQTLKQMAGATDGEIPCCTMYDAPDFQTRGVLHDVTRGKVPTLDTLKRLVDWLAGFKINQFQLYMEHAFVFSFDSRICDGAHGLTADEVAELDAFATQRFMQLVPAIATLGHMGRILSMPRYRRLAEIEPGASWDKMDWPTRARGLTLDCRNPDAWRLVERIWADVFDAFSAPVVNICGDEPWDLGQGASHARIEGDARGHAYLDHIVRTHALCARAGRQCCFWSDVVTKYPALLERIPRDATVLHWGYDDQAEYEATSDLTRAGLKTFVCPGTSAWKRIIPAMDLAERNISRFARAGKSAGAAGMITTDWGDHGHFNPLACSRHGMALGACLAWNVDHPRGRAFDEAFAAHGKGAFSGEGLAGLRELGRRDEAGETWPWFWKPPRKLLDGVQRPPRESAEERLELAVQTARTMPAIALDASECGLDGAELRLACEFSALLSRKIMLLSDGKGGRAHRADFGDWAADVRSAVESYAAAWMQRNKRSGLSDIVVHLERMVEDVGRFVGCSAAAAPGPE